MNHRCECAHSEMAHRNHMDECHAVRSTGEHCTCQRFVHTSYMGPSSCCPAITPEALDAGDDEAQALRDDMADAIGQAEELLR